MKRGKVLGPLPGPKGLPLIGNIHQARGMNETIEKLVEWHSIYGRIYSVHLGSQEVISVTDPQVAEHLVKASSKASDDGPYHKMVSNIFTSYFPNNILTATGERWRRIRSVVKNAIASQSSTEIVSVISDVVAERALPIIEKNAAKSPAEFVDAEQLISALVINAIGRVFFGSDAEGGEEGPSVADLLEPVQTIAKLTPTQVKLPFQWMRKLPTKNNRRMSSAVAQTHCFVRALMDRHIHNDNNDNSKSPSQDQQEKQSNKASPTILQKLVASEKLSLDEIPDNMLSLIFAALESTTTSVCFIFHFLATHPKEQEILHKEIISHMEQQHPHANNSNVEKKSENKTDDEELSVPRFSTEQLQSMRYLDAVIKETMRLLPPAPLYIRSTLQDVHIPLNTTTTINNSKDNDDYEEHKEPHSIFIPKGVIVMINRHKQSRMGELWPNSPTDMDEFRPQRWLELDENVPKRIYAPFGSGARICVGERMAVLEIKAILALILAKYKVLPDHERPMRLGMGIFRFPKGGAWFSFSSW